jgi:hypothetical protein
MAKADPGRQGAAAVRLGVSLAPAGARVAFLAVSDRVVARADWGLADDGLARERLKAATGGLPYGGYTDFSSGIATALDMLEDGGRVIFLGDPIEGGHDSPVPLSEAEKAGRFAEVALAAQKRGIVVDLLLLSDGDYPGRSYLEALAGDTGGRAALSGSDAPFSVALAELLLDVYTYNAREMSLDEGSKAIALPAERATRARLLVLADGVLADPGKVEARYAGNRIAPAEYSPYHSLYDFTRPSREGITLASGGSAAEASGADTQDTRENLRAILLVDYEVSLAAAVESESRPDESAVEDGADAPPIQVSRLLLDIADTESGDSVLSQSFLAGAAVGLTLIPPEGEAFTLTPLFDGKNLVAELSPASFGDYEINLSVQKDGVSLTPSPVRLDIPDIRPVPEPRDPWALTERAALILGACLIVAAAVFGAIYKGKPFLRERIFHAHVLGELAGRLEIFIVWAKAGEYEIPSMTFYLNRLRNRHKVSLAEILAMCDVSPTAFPAKGAERILFSAKAGSDLRVKNGSGALIKAAGKEIGRGEYVALSFGEKCYIVFDERVNELEINFRRSRDSARAGKGGDRRVYATRGGDAA